MDYTVEQITFLHPYAIFSIYCAAMPFDFDEYEEMVKGWSTPYLEKQVQKYIQQTSGSSTSGGIGIALAPFTGGLSLFGTAISAATYGNGLKKLTILRKELDKRNEAITIRKRDFVVPSLFALGTAGVTHGTGSAMHSLAHNAAQHGHHAVTNNPHMISLGEKAIKEGVDQGCKGIGSRINKVM